MDTIFAIMTEEKGNQKETIKFSADRIRKYFPEKHNTKADGGLYYPSIGA